MKKLLLSLLFCLSAAAQVQTSIDQLGSTMNWVMSFRWSADGSGAVPITKGVLNGCCAGYTITQIEIVPGVPSPTSGYSVSILDTAGADILKGAGANQSATVPAFLIPAPPPLQGVLSLSITGQSVGGAKGVVFVFLSQTPLAVTGGGGSGGNGITALTGDVTAGPGSGPQVATSKAGGVRVQVANTNGNDTGNDTPAITAAIAAACNGTLPGTVLMGPVTGKGPIYQQTTKINMVSNCTLEMGTATLHMATAGLNSIEINGSSNFTIRGGTLDGGEIANAGGAATNIVIEGVTIKNTASNSGVFRFALYSASPCTNCWFRDNTITNVGGVMDVATAHGFHAVNNTVTTCSSATCFNFHDGGSSDSDPLSSYDVEINFNTISDAYQFGIQIQSWMAYQNKVTILGNNLKNWNASTVAAGGNGISCDPASAGGGCLISGNYVQGLGAIDTRTYIGIENTATGTVSSHNVSIGWQEGIFNDGGATNIGSFNSIVDNYIYNCKHAISVQGGPNVDIQIARNYVFEYVDWGVLFDVNSGSGANVIENHFFRTPHNTDTGGPTAIGTQSIGSSGKLPQTFRDNTSQWLAGTFATGVPYQMFFVAANTPGSTFINNKDENLNASFATLYGFNCNSGTVLDTNTIKDSSWVNINPTNCSTSSTVVYGNNQSLGTSAVQDFLTSGSNFPNGICAGVSCPSALPSGSNGIACPESSTAGTPTSGVDYLRCDSTTHTIRQSLNGGAESSLVSGPIVRAIAFAVGDPGGSAITAGSTATAYVTVPFACTITAWDLLIDAGTVTVKFWKVATGTAIPTSAASINTSGVAISTGTAIHSTTLTDFTTTAVALNDIVAMNVSTVATAKYVQGVLQCQ